MCVTLPPANQHHHNVIFPQLYDNKSHGIRSSGDWLKKHFMKRTPMRNDHIHRLWCDCYWNETAERRTLSRYYRPPLVPNMDTEDQEQSCPTGVRSGEGTNSGMQMCVWGNWSVWLYFCLSAGFGICAHICVRLFIFHFNYGDTITACAYTVCKQIHSCQVFSMKKCFCMAPFSVFVHLCDHAWLCVCVCVLTVSLLHISHVSCRSITSSLFYFFTSGHQGATESIRGSACPLNR